jgi:hypothetical protein
MAGQRQRFARRGPLATGLLAAKQGVGVCGHGDVEFGQPFRPWSMGSVTGPPKRLMAAADIENITLDGGRFA